jgi:hypothetical protein
MAQYFLLSAAARTLSLKAIFAGGEQKAYRRSNYAVTSTFNTRRHLS